jgi:hypothetical protein
MYPSIQVGSTVSRDSWSYSRTRTVCSTVRGCRTPGRSGRPTGQPGMQQLASRRTKSQPAGVCRSAMLLGSWVGVCCTSGQPAMQVSQQDCCKPCILCVHPVIHALCFTVIAQPAHHRNSLLNLPSRHHATTMTVRSMTTTTMTAMTTMTATRLRPWQAPRLQVAKKRTAYGDGTRIPVRLFADMSLSW